MLIVWMCLIWINVTVEEEASPFIYSCSRLCRLHRNEILPDMIHTMTPIENIEHIICYANDVD